MSNPRYYLTRRSNGIYYFGIRTAGKLQWRTTKCRRKSDALKFIRDFSHAQSNEKTPAPKLSDFLPLYLNRSQGSIRPSTGALYSLHISTFIREVGDKPLSEYTIADFDAFKETRLKKVRPVTLNIELRVLKSVFGKAYAWEVTETNVGAKVRFVRVPEQKPLYLTKGDFAKLLTNVEEPLFRDLWLFLVLTGCRISEALNLTWQDIDLPNRQIRIGNSSKFTTKTGRERFVPIHDTLVQSLLLKKAEQVCPLVFHRNGFKLDRTYVTHRFKLGVRQAQLDPHLKLHSLRHSAAAWWVQSGVPLLTVARLLGHSSTITTELYAHLAPNNYLDSVNKVSLNVDF